MTEDAAAALVRRVTERIPSATPAPEDLVRGQAVVMVPREDAAAALAVLRDDPALRFDRLCDVTCVDYFGRTPRFEVVYQLHALQTHERLRVKVPVPEEDPTIPSAVPLWKSANWAEREVYDLFGIRFLGHPDLRRILMYPEFEGHPLRKDYELNRRQPLVPERDPIAQPWPKRAGRI
jgi:NADH-quinone oxidoreductase subunit C